MSGFNVNMPLMTLLANENRPKSDYRHNNDDVIMRITWLESKTTKAKTFEEKQWHTEKEQKKMYYFTKKSM